MQAGFLKKEVVVAAISADALEAKFKHGLTTCAALRSKPADEEEPYVFRYEEREALQLLLKQAAANAAVEPNGADAARARVIGGVLECWLGINYMDTEEPGSGQARLERAIEALDIETAPAEAVRLIDALNHLGILWANRGETERSLERLTRAEALHKRLTGDGAAVATELREGSEQLEDLHTLTCFYLAQAYGNLGTRDRSAAYCHTTMMRQLGRRGGTAQGEHAFQVSWPRPRTWPRTRTWTWTWPRLRSWSWPWPRPWCWS